MYLKHATLPPIGDFVDCLMSCPICATIELLLFITECTGYQETAEERGVGRRRHDNVLSKKTSKKWVSAGMESAGSPVTVMDGGFSSPDAPRGTGGLN